ncbi:hypothetical protein H5410_045811 [Solanum commersonii]|uniref:Uncharacterized protein n=1 Tax=Solanum commersonii TaxID=4109 RepID=A0A9J5XAK0_SOLCO|nr:hypothetical protein H5410_045811 [Solanum commersonii]
MEERQDFMIEEGLHQAVIVRISNNFVKKSKNSWGEERSLAPDENLKTLTMVAATMTGEARLRVSISQNLLQILLITELLFM